MGNVNTTRLLAEIEILRQRVTELEQERTTGSPPENSASWQQELFRILVEHAQDYAIFVIDPEGIISTWNTGGERMFGYGQEEIWGCHLSRLYSQEDVDAGKPAHDLERVVREGRSEDEGWQVRKDGTRLFVNAIMMALRDQTGRVQGFSRVVRDITERKLAEEALRVSEQRFRLFMDHSPTVNFIQEPDGPFLYVDETWERMFGSMVGEWVGRTNSEVWPAEVAARLSEQEQLFVTSGQPFESLESLPTLRGEAQWRFYRFTFVDPAGRRLIGGIGMECTEQECAKEEVRRLNADLEWRVEKRTAELVAANEELNAFCYSVSHDLRAPLRGIDGFSQVLLEDCAGKLDEMELDCLHRVRAEAQRMGQLIDDLLELSRVARIEIRRERVNMSGLAADIVERFQRREPQRDAEVIIAQDIIVDADERLLRIVLENLLANAWKFTGTHPRARIQVGAVALPDGTTSWFVRDDGVGFNMSYADHLFGAFQRLHSEAEFPGTGIGLATVQRIIHRHGGRVWAKSAVEQGATFYFTLGGSQ